MKLRTTLLATALALTSTLAAAQTYEPAPIGSDADWGNGAVINRGPVPTVGEDMDYRTNRSRSTVGQAPEDYRSMRQDRMLPERAVPDAAEAAPAGR